MSTGLHLEVAGEGPPVLLIHGVGAAGRVWSPQVEGLAARFRLAWYDHPGLGASPARDDVSIGACARDAAGLLDRLGWATAHVVGHSLGGVVAQQLALDAPERVRSLALLGTFHRGVDGAWPSARVAWLGLRTRVGTRAMRRRAFVELVCPRSLHGDRDAVADALAAVFGRDLADPPAAATAQLRALGAHDASARLAELRRHPALVVSADEDPIAPPLQGRRLAEALGGRYVELSGASHAFPIHRAAECNALLAEHLAGAEGRPR